MEDYLKNHFLNDCKAILGRIKTGDIRQEAYAEGVEAGRKAEEDAFWEVFQDGGNRTDYQYAFYTWSAAEYIRPKYKIVPTTINGAASVFYRCKKLKKIEPEYFDFSQKPTGDTTASGYSHTFNSCNSLEEIKDLGFIPQHSYYSTFAYCGNLKTITRMAVNEKTVYNAVFTQCKALENLTIDGTIGQNGFNVSDCTKLSPDSLRSIINALKDYSEDTSGTEWLIRVGSDNLTKLEKEDLLAEVGRKGWNIQ